MKAAHCGKLVQAVLALALCLGGVSALTIAEATSNASSAIAAQKDGTWKKSSGMWWYAYAGGGYAKGWAKIDNTWYLFDSSGWMRTGWAKVGGTWYYLKGSGAMAEGWTKVGGTWYYLNPSSGAMATGWKKVDSIWYYLNGSGAMQTGWMKSGGTWYYLKGSGAMAEGWAKVGGTWYYLQPGSGAMRTGWYQADGQWYYSDASGTMLSNTWIGNYCLTSSGSMAVDTWIGRYYVGTDGKWIPSGKPSSNGQEQHPDQDKPETQLRNPDWNDSGKYWTVNVGRTTKNFSVKGGQEVQFYSYHFLGSEVVSAVSSNERVLAIDRAHSFWAYAYAVSDGTATVTLRYQNGQSYSYNVTVVGNDSYRHPYNVGRATWIKENLSSAMSDAQKVEAIQRHISGDYTYSMSHTSGLSLFLYGDGSCLAGATMLKNFCDDLGIRCERRFAGDDLEKYHINYGQTTGHYNCFVWIDGVQYLCDATPGTYIAMFPWQPEKWARDLQFSSGEKPISQGPRDEEPIPVDNIAGDATYLGGYNISLGLTKPAFTITNEGAYGLPGIHMVAYLHTFNTIASSNPSVIEVSPYFASGEEYGSANILGKGNTELTITLDDGSVWTYNITVV